MIQSRFQEQHASKHPQRPENGGSGPKPMPASRDATSNVRANGGRPDVGRTANAMFDLGLEGPQNDFGNMLSDSDYAAKPGEHEHVEHLTRTVTEQPKEHITSLYRGRTRGQAVDTVALKKRMSADSARVTNGSKRAIADNETAVHLLDPRAKKAAFRDVDDKLTDVRLGAARHKARSDTLETERSLYRGRTRGQK